MGSPKKPVSGNEKVEPGQSSEVGKTIPLEVQGDQIVHLTLREAEMGSPAELSQSYQKKFAQCPNGNLIFTLDQASWNAAPTLITENSECFLRLDSPAMVEEFLSAVNLYSPLQALTLCGDVQSILRLANGGAEVATASPFDSAFITTMLQKRELDAVTVQALRESPTPEIFLLNVSRRKLGWLFDEVCRAACFEVRKLLRRSVKLEVTLFGSSGAVLGRACLEPGTFRI